MSPHPTISADETSGSKPATSEAARFELPLHDEQKILHVLNRTTFGPRPGDVERVRQTGVERFLDEQLHPEGLDDSAVDAQIAALPTLSMSPEELVENYPAPQAANKQARRAGWPPQGASAPAPEAAKPHVPPLISELEGPRRVIMELAQEEVLRALSSQRQIQEVMVQFWMNHFNIFVDKGADRWLLTSFERETIRPRALGKFEDLLVATAQSPAMLFYLDNWQSATPTPSFPARRAPYGRPGAFQRPFARPGFGPARGPFTAARINEMEAMRAERMMKQGKTVRRGLNENYGRELMELHTLGVDGGYTQKDVIEVARCLTGWTIDRPNLGGGFIFRPQMHDFGAKVVLGHKIKGGRGMEDGVEVLHLLANHPSTASFISTKLCRRFISDDPPPSAIERASAEFRKSHGDIRKVLKSLFTSPEFNSQAAFQSKVKSPMELATSTLRALGAKADVDLPLLAAIGRMGEPMFHYQAPTGYPDRANTWIDTGSLLNRINFAMMVASGRFPGVELEPNIFGNSSGGASGAADIESAVDSVANQLLGRPLEPQARGAILKSLNRDEGSASPWSAGNAPEPPVRLIASLVLASPDFQKK